MAAPALRISNVVTGRQNKGSRVSYLVAPGRSGLERAAPETVVLKRWRQRELDGYTFSGARLSPTVWRAVAATFPERARMLESSSVEEIAARIQATRRARQQQHLALPDAGILQALALDLGAGRLGQLIDRHTANSFSGKSGVPDLYLFALSSTVVAKPAFSRFVEVKRPRERISKEQEEEISFLQSLGLQARVLRLIERG